jgi:hypothetical protein
MPYLALLLLAFRRFILSALALMAAALISPTPRPPNGFLQVILNHWGLTLEWIGKHLFPSYLIVIVAVLALGRIRGLRPGSVLTVFHWTWALVAVFILVPHLASIYPAPRTGVYYESFLRQPWLPAEVITATPDQVYSGYVISNSNGWFTVLLLKRRSISYIKASNVTSRTACQTQQTPSPPLIPLLQTKTATLRACPGIDIQTTAKPSPSTRKMGTGQKAQHRRKAVRRCRSGCHPSRCRPFRAYEDDDIGDPDVIGRRPGRELSRPPGDPELRGNGLKTVHMRQTMPYIENLGKIRVKSSWLWKAHCCRAPGRPGRLTRRTGRRAWRG